MPGSVDPSAVLRRVVALALELPGQVLEDLAGRLERVSALAGEERTAVLDAMSQPGVRGRVGDLLDLWQVHELGPPVSLAWTLRGAHATDAEHRRRQQLELVWTGPTAHGTTLRRTDQVLLELVRGARRRLLIVSFAAYRVPAVHEALVLAAARGVAIDFVFETPDDGGGRIDADPRRALGPDLLRQTSLWEWPLEKREREEGGRPGLLHAKCAVTDGERLLVSSANFTGRALLLNMELGVLVEGGELPRTVEEHVDGMMREGVLRRA